MRVNPKINRGRGSRVVWRSFRLHVALARVEEAGELLVNRGLQLDLPPEVRSEVPVGGRQSRENRLEEVAPGLGGTRGTGEAVLDTGEGEQLLGGRSADDLGSPGRRHQPGPDTSTLARHLHRHSVRLADHVAPVAAPDWNERELGRDDGATDGGSNFLGALGAQSTVSVEVTDSDEDLETRALTSVGLLLHGHDLDDVVGELLVGEGGLEEVVHNLVLLDGNGVKVDLLDGLDQTGRDQTSQLGDRHPVLEVILTATTAPANY
ncbi:ankyrin repeat domain-containing protein 55 [Babesia caballi]|uniref:Ankyrin repeat domain-containing protein 55 n=1 Tax=Babesia caballi TaxID=5871 RepID=A0AAV4M203_BABCB|nr:ankyrin repeat domain-containing protein 55 [Babesia caballi]